VKPYWINVSAAAAFALTPVAAHSQDQYAVGGTFVMENAKTEEGCIGFVDVLSAAEGSGWSSAGWAWNLAQGEAPQSVVLVGSDDTVIALAQIDEERPDVAQAILEVTSDRVGWSVTGEGEPPSHDEVTAYALLDNETVCLPPLQIAKQDSNPG
jgi:hypothetical protein